MHRPYADAALAWLARNSNTWKKKKEFPPPDWKEPKLKMTTQLLFHAPLRVFCNGTHGKVSRTPCPTASRPFWFEATLLGEIKRNESFVSKWCAKVVENGGWLTLAMDSVALHFGNGGGVLLASLSDGVRVSGPKTLGAPVYSDWFVRRR